MMTQLKMSAIAEGAKATGETVTAREVNAELQGEEKKKKDIKADKL